MTVGKHSEAENPPIQKHDGPPPSEPTALQNFATTCHGEKPSSGAEAKAEKVAPEKFFLDRLSEISLNADKSSGKINQAHVAWNRLFNPAGFNPTANEESPAESLCLAAKIYGDKA